MKRALIYLNGMKSRYFVLVACLSLVVATTSCSNDEFETNLPEEQRQYTKAELIEQALSRMPRTRANTITTTMVTIKDSIRIQFLTTEDVIINWDNEKKDTITAGSIIKRYAFKNTHPSHYIFISGSELAMRSLTIDDNEIIFLNASGNKNLTTLSCTNNHLDKIGLTHCTKLQHLYVSNNEFSFIDVTPFSNLTTFHIEYNRLTNIDISANRHLDELFIGNNKIKDFNLLANQDLYVLDLKNNPIRNLDLSKNFNLIYLDISFTMIADLDLSQNINLMGIYMEDVPIEILNNQPIKSTSFSIFPSLELLNIAYIPFDSLDISENPRVYYLNISGTNITQLDLSANPRMERLYANHSKLIHLTHGSNQLNYFYELHIKRTPFEDALMTMTDLLNFLPDRQNTTPGHLYTYYINISDMTPEFLGKNWLINK